MSGNVFPEVKTSSDEVQEINDQKHQRTFDPEENYYNQRILQELTLIRKQLELITGEKIDAD